MGSYLNRAPKNLADVVAPRIYFYLVGVICRPDFELYKAKLRQLSPLAPLKKLK